MERWDVIVVGAGIAGLTAAAGLSKAGLKVLILEARDRVGGRIFSLPSLVPEHAIELGAEFVHGKPKQFDDFVAQHKLQLRETDGQSYCVERSSLKDCDGPSTDIFEQLSDAKPDAFPDQPFEQTLRTRFCDRSEEEKAWARRFVQGFHAADPARISTRSIVVDGRAEQETDGDRAFHVVGGYLKVIESLCRDLGRHSHVTTGTVVEAVRWRQNHVVVKARAAGNQSLEFVTPKLVITLPLGVLQQNSPAAGAVSFDPPLAQKFDALSGLVMGSVVRCVLQFDKLFWEHHLVAGRHQLKSLHFLFTEDPVFPTFWTPMPLRLPLLVAWAAGPLADAKAGWSARHIESEALATLARVLSLPLAEVQERFVRSFYHDWQGDPYSRGAYSYVLAGNMQAQRELAHPLRNTLFFAGEATQGDGHHATVHGAFMSGLRAADEVLANLRR